MSREPHPQLRQALVATAAEVFAEQGLDRARVSDITDRAGTSKGAFYLYFESKEALYLQVARAFLQDLLAHLRAYDDEACSLGAMGPAEERTQELDEKFCAFLWGRRLELRMVLEGAAGTELAYLADEILDSVVHHMREDIARNVRAHPPLAQVIDAEFGAMMAAGIVYMYARQIIRATTPPDMARQVTRFRQHVLVALCQSLPPTLDASLVAAPLEAKP